MYSHRNFSPWTRSRLVKLKFSRCCVPLRSGIIGRPRARSSPSISVFARPILAQEHIEAYVRFDTGWFRPRADYLLRVKGMSMRDAGILDGDLLAVHRATTAESGQIVVARLDDEVTVKRLQRRGNRIRLLPANPDFKPIDVDPRRGTFAIEGIGVGVLRNGLSR